MNGRYTITVPDVPPSLNSWLSRHWRVREADKKRWQDEINFACLAAQIPRAERIEAEVYFRFPDKRRRDHDNYTATLSKALGDALKLRWISDDDAERFWVRRSRIEQTVGPKLTTIVLDLYDELEAAA